jgi:hypothetical protein
MSYAGSLKGLLDSEGKGTAICRIIRNCLPKQRIISEVLDLKEEGVFFVVNFFMDRVT